MTREVCRSSCKCRRGDVVLGVCGVEAGYTGRVELRSVDEGDVGADVEGLVLGTVEVSGVFELECGVGAWGDRPGSGVGYQEAGVARVDFGDDVGDEGNEVGLGLRVYEFGE